MTKNYMEAAVEIAREAGKVLREELERPPDIAYKGDFDLVTQADRRSEAVIVSRLQKYFPQHTVAAEEGTGRDTGSEFRWHVDPLDGTRLKSSPSTVSITFDENVGLGSLGYLNVINEAGKRVSIGAAYHPNGMDSIVAVNLPPGLSDGTYTESYRVISADSHPVGGVVRFVVGNGPTTVNAPAGAARLQLGFNDDLYSDNAGRLEMQVTGPALGTVVVSGVSVHTSAGPNAWHR